MTFKRAVCTESGSTVASQVGRNISDTSNTRLPMTAADLQLLNLLCTKHTCRARARVLHFRPCKECTRHEYTQHVQSTQRQRYCGFRAPFHIRVTGPTRIVDTNELTGATSDVLFGSTMRNRASSGLVVRRMKR